MAKQIAVSDEVYELLSKMKNENQSFSEVIKAMAAKKRKKQNVMKCFGILKNDKDLVKVEKMIADDRRRNMGRQLNW